MGLKQASLRRSHVNMIVYSIILLHFFSYRRARSSNSEFRSILTVIESGAPDKKKIRKKIYKINYKRNQQEISRIAYYLFLSLWVNKKKLT